jgi:ankyrin repeat protein
MILVLDKDSKFDKYLGQLQEAIVEFIRTNNPSKLFRRTRLLIAKCDENPPPLDDAIRHGHIDLVLKLIEQIGDISSSNSLFERENNDGETPLLLSAKLNHRNLIEAILKNRIELSEKTDKYNNNILHLLAKVSDDKANETIKHVLALLSDDRRIKLLKEKNKANQTPIDIARIKNNTHCFDLLKKSELFL